MHRETRIWSSLCRRPMQRILASGIWLLVILTLTAYGSRPPLAQAQSAQGVKIFEGARLISGDGGAPIENSAFVVENTQFTRVGKRGELQAPPGAARIDLTGKTVIPAKVDLHGHIGFQHDV